MGKKQKLLRARSLIDIISRWKLYRDGEEIKDKIAEYKDAAEETEAGYQAFVQTVKEEMYKIEVEMYQEMIRYKKTPLENLKYYVHHVPFLELQSRLRQTVSQWKKERDDILFDAQVQVYQTLIIENKATLEDIYERIADDVKSTYLKRRLYAIVELWAQERKGPENELERFAHDKQNIHTFVVSNHTNDMLEILQTVPVPKEQKTMADICKIWQDFTELSIVEQDMRTWAKKSMVVKENDFLYRNTLRAVVAKIRMFAEETQKELFQRLWEECYEAVGMCAQGHICRLVNVFVGFDERFVNAESVQGSLQDKMANISLLEISAEEKIMAAKQIMDEMKIPVESQQVWLDALKAP